MKVRKPCADEGWISLTNRGMPAALIPRDQYPFINTLQARPKHVGHWQGREKLLAVSLLKLIGQDG